MAIQHIGFMGPQAINGTQAPCFVDGNGTLFLNQYTAAPPVNCPLQ